MLFRVQRKVHILCQHDVVIDLRTDEFAPVVVEIPAVFIPQSQLIRLFLHFRERTDFLFIRPLRRAMLRAAPMQSLRLLAVLVECKNADYADTDK